MELEELLQQEGVSADDLAETVAWAQSRAEELVSGLVADGELGPLLDGDFNGEVPRRRDPAAPAAARRTTTEPAPAADAPLARETAAALAELPPPPGEPMAAAAYDHGSVARPLPGPDDSGRTTDDITQPRAIPTEGPAITTSGAIELDPTEIEMLDEDDLELVDDGAGDDNDPPAPAADAREVPEWQAALTSATLGGDSKADQDSGLHRLPADEAGDALTDPSKGAPPPTPKKLVPLPVEHDESMDIDLGDF